MPKLPFCRRALNTSTYFSQPRLNRVPYSRQLTTSMASQINVPKQDNDMTPNGNTGKRPVVCVFCGASPGTSPAHLSAARSLAQAFHTHGIHLVYGGGTVGIMGEVARTLVSLSGPQAVHGVIPEALLRYERNGRDKNGEVKVEIDENVYGRTTVVKDMHTRKQLMAKEVIESGPGGGFVALSGGYGTLEELMEVITWNQLGIHERGIVVYNIEGYWDGLLAWVKKSVEEGFVSKKNEEIMVEAKTAGEVVDRLKNYTKAEGRFGLDWENK
ncbi:Bifunctional cytokinin biosynthesis protein [Pseudocercospora fuligena]|uniref:Bifunctional cytokinin biosynthesis protein n=1 Tax=Pseudocercospora fuligena TaxID=685502 RepID=A0A8H6VCH7_9PEZI|nr:Bifunctional cytokinin biosynthesis protein [Pseudocercospora fuligena]